MTKWREKRHRAIGNRRPMLMSSYPAFQETVLWSGRVLICHGLESSTSQDKESDFIRKRGKRSEQDCGRGRFPQPLRPKKTLANDV